MSSKFVAEKFCILSGAIARRSTLLSVVAVVFVFSLAAGESEAGVILPLAQETALVDFGLPAEATGSSSAPSTPAPTAPRNQHGEDQYAALGALDGLVGTGGASIPQGSVAGAGVFGAAAVFDAPAILPVVRAFRYLREHRVQLPHPPLGELLDPPKAV